VTHPLRVNVILLIAALLAACALIALGISLAWGANDREEIADVVERNCQSIEELKAIVRPEPFDLERTKSLLTDLDIDPDSPEGQRLIIAGRRTTARERRELAPSDC
jgi:hypothetical protein